MKIAALIDFFIHPVHFSNLNQLRRARLFVRACLLTSLFSNTYAWLSHLFDYERGVYLMTFNVIGFLILPLFAKTRLPIAWLGNLYVFIGASAVSILTYYSGGVWSAVYPWLTAIPILALLVVSKNSGIFWGVISFFTMLWFASFAYRGIDLPIEYNPELKTLWYITVLPGLLLIILFIALVFESIQSRALSELESKNEVLKHQKEIIEHQTSELEKLIEEKKFIITILAHDLKNPLANITSIVNLIDGESDADQRKEYVRLIDESSSKAQNLISRMMEAEAADQVNVDLPLEPIDVGVVIGEVTKLINETAKKKQIQIDLINESAPCTVQADETYLSLIFENLLSNAIKFSEKEKKVQVVISREASNVRVKIIDQGPGVKPDEERRLFKKFSRLSARPTAGENSTGLGLSLVKRYVEMLRGKVWYEATPDIGATFIVEFPLAE